ncbi:D-alanine--D-alanine ligase [Glacieibacterium frigidum]|uniref:D-alanine--D-alanine ligase n=1 Tax=Glacieibacterium frigidum TaxID=2593303 RepID=UPI00163DACE1|nr:D-alanine--D-alanine ligase [Glacieibacterium frigidum]
MLIAEPNRGMPPLAPAPALSFFEFWPAKLFYLPVWVWVLWLSLRHGGLRLPLVANPLFPAGGLFGEVKSDILDQIGGSARRWVARYVKIARGDGLSDTVAEKAIAAARADGLDFPLVAKPELGCRGAGVRPVHSAADLAAYVAGFPHGESFLLQQLIDVEGEAGVFYVREPGAERGEIISLTLKYFPYVIGDGRRTLAKLIRADPRAGRLAHLYLPRHTARLGQVLGDGETFRLAFAGSHSRGAIFRDGTPLVTEAMRARFDAIAREVPEFWFGRFDVRFANFADLQRGQGFTILECNGAGSESTHVWDSRTTLFSAYAALFRQYALLWRIGAANRRRGFRPEGWGAFLARRRRELDATPAYPMTA